MPLRTFAFSTSRPNCPFSSPKNFFISCTCPLYMGCTEVAKRTGANSLENQGNANSKIWKYRRKVKFVSSVWRNHWDPQGDNYCRRYITFDDLGLRSNSHIGPASRDSRACCFHGVRPEGRVKIS